MTQIYYERYGQGERLLLIHGAGSSSRVWLPLYKWVVAEREVIAVDLPGHGQSPPLADNTPPTPARFTDLLISLLQELGLADVHVAGNSSGGWIGLELAKRGYAQSVTALSPAGLWCTRTPRQVIAVFWFSSLLARLVKPATPTLLRTAFYRTLLLSHFFGRPWRMSQDEAEDVVRTFAEAQGLWPHLLATARGERFRGGQGIVVPVTIAWGTQDWLLLPSQARRQNELPPQTRWLTLPSCGHVPMFDDPELVARTLLNGSKGSSVLDSKRQYE